MIIISKRIFICTTNLLIEIYLKNTLLLLEKNQLNPSHNGVIQISPTQRFAFNVFQSFNKKMGFNNK